LFIVGLISNTLSLIGGELVSGSDGCIAGFISNILSPRDGETVGDANGASVGVAACMLGGDVKSVADGKGVLVASEDGKLVG
jgi:hypothetical protein